MRKTLESIFSQTYKEIESIIIDGASTDGSLDALIGFEKRISYIISEPDTGIYNAMNKGTAQAIGEYCLFLNSGDFLYRTDTLQRIMERKPEADIVYFDVMIDSGTHQVLGKMPESLSYHLFVEHEIWHQALIKRNLFERFGLYDESYRLLGDYEFYVRTIIKNSVSTQYMDITIAVFNTFGIGSRPESRRLAQRERRRAQRANLSFWDFYWKFTIQYFIVFKLLRPILKALLSRELLEKVKKSAGIGQPVAPK